MFMMMLIIMGKVHQKPSSDKFQTGPNQSLPGQDGSLASLNHLY